MKVLLSLVKLSHQQDYPGFSSKSNFFHMMILADRMVVQELLEMNVIIINTNGNYNLKQ